MPKVNPLLTLFLLVFTFSTACSSNAKPAPQTSVNNSGNKNPLVTMTMNSGKIIYIELYPDIAPNSVNNFISLIQNGFYDGVIFHRVIPGFMIQGGDPTGTGMGGPGYLIHGEFSNNNFENNLKHTRGVLSMARSRHPDSAGSQFFIMHNDYTGLDGEYAAFGRLIGEGSFETLDLIGNTAPDAQERPLVEWKIKKMTVDTKGYQYTVVKNEE